jgi:predicted RNA-binding Zn ribbon-like protein
MMVIMTNQDLTPGTDVAVLARIGGNRCLDFVNTLVAADEPVARDSLSEPADYRRWAKLSGIAVDAAADAKGDVAALRRAKSLRAAIRAIAVAIADGNPVPDDAAALLTAEAERSFRSRKLAPGKTGLGWVRSRRDLDSVTDQLAAEAVALFADGATPRLKRCIGNHCGWLFLDLSRNGSRRWCSMQDCGNRAKARRHRERAREEA